MAKRKGTEAGFDDDEGVAEDAPAEAMASAPPPGEIPMALMEFAQTHSPRRDRELMGGFVWYAKRQGWATATPSEWKARFEAFRVMEA